jgi:cell division septation protein DedD
MNPGIYLFELLFEYDCVIIPGFGGFIGNYAPARIQTAYHTFFPPYKSLLFNVNLKQNDGLLAFRISQKEKVTYADALLSIESEVSRWNKELNGGRTIEINRVGKLYKDKEGIIHFDQDEEVNFLQESYGLSSFVSPGIKRQEGNRTLEKKILQYTSAQGDNRHVIPKALKWAAILSLPIGIAAILGISNFDKIKTLSVAYSGMLISNNSPTPVKDNHSSTTPSRIYKPERVEGKALPPVNAAVKQESRPSQAEHSKPFAIIVGAFRFPENAEGLVSDLKAKGYDASIAGQTKTGLYRVSIHSFSDKEEAFRQLAIVRSNEFSSAWILVK